MGWIVKIRKSAVKQIKHLDKIAQQRIFTFLAKVEKTGNPRKYGKKLTGNQDDLWRYRVGDYRIICQFEDKTVTVLVLVVGHRKEVYRC